MIDLGKVAAIAVTSVRRLVRDRLNLFFVFVLPVLLITVIGVVFGGGFTPRVGVVSDGAGALGAEVVAALEATESIRTQRFEDATGLRRAVDRGDVEVGLILPESYDTALRRGAVVEVEFLARPSTGGIEVQAVVTEPIATQAVQVRAALFARDVAGLSYDEALAVARRAESVAPILTVAVVGNGAGSTVGQFDLGAAQNLVLFMFVTSLAASAALIQARRLGVSRRMLSTPTSARTVVSGETAGRFSVAMVQGLFIAGVAAAVFGVNWGQAAGAVALIVAFALVGTGGAMLVGATFRNEDQAGGIGTFLGLGLGALGGCMVPLEIFSPTMRNVAHVTPHAWALDGFSELIRNDGGIGDIVLEIAVLFAFAVVLIGVASWRFRRAITA